MQPQEKQNKFLSGITSIITEGLNVYIKKGKERKGEEKEHGFLLMNGMYWNEWV